MAHAPSCSGRVYGCPKCGKTDMTIDESFDHECGDAATLLILGGADERKQFLTAARGGKVTATRLAHELRHDGDGNVLCPACDHHDVAMWADDGEAWAADWWQCETFSGGCGATGAVVPIDDHARTQNGLAVQS